MQGRFEEAIPLAARLVRDLAEQGGAPYRRFDAETQLHTLTRAGSLSGPERRRLAAADSLNRELADLEIVQDNLGSVIACTRQLRIRTEILGPEHPETLESWFHLGEIYHRAGIYDRAEMIFAAGLGKGTGSLPPDHPLLARFHYGLGLVCKDSQRFGEAIDHYFRGMEILERSRPVDEPVMAEVLQGLAHVYRRQHRLEEGEDAFRRSLTLLVDHFGPRSREVAEARTWFGWYLLVADKTVESERELLTSAGLLRELGDPVGARETLGFLRSVYLKRGETARADSVQRVRDGLPVAHRFEPISLEGRTGPPGNVVEEDMASEERTVGAWTLLGNVSGTISTRYLALRRLEETSRRGRELKRVREEALVWDRRTRTAEPGGREYASSLYRLLLAEGRRLELERAIRTGGATAGPDGLARIQASLHPGEAIVGWVYEDGRDSRTAEQIAYVLRSRGPIAWVGYRMLSWNEEERSYRRPIHSLMEAIRKDSTWPRRLPRDPEVSRLARQAWDCLMSPVEPHLDGVRSLIVAGLPLELEVPIEVLQDPDGMELIDRYAVSYVPSAPFFALLREWEAEHPTPRGRPALIVGDPDFSQDPLPPAEDTPRSSYLEPTLVRSMLAGRGDALRTLPRLPYAADEVRAVAEAFPRGSVLMTGRDASEGNLARLREENRLSRFGILHFATHALIDDGAFPERSALAFSRSSLGTPREGLFDGLLTTREILLGWTLDADLVTLSACQTASGSSGKAREVLGFFQSFFRAGARTVVSSQWKVDDRATELLMGRFYENLAGNYSGDRGGFPAGTAMGKLAALREAKQWLRDLTDDGGRRPFENPAYWAGFILTGEPD